MGRIRQGVELESCARYAGWMIPFARIPQACAWGYPSFARFAGWGTASLRGVDQGDFVG